ncbi:hypothetical protein HZH66_012496 [Vespula vulgaris]|uniref:Uncharacterized protein n=1 Tax=Vespula vulgaris TaxID=7454 RepID=A0A834J947_VESVU|nr:hypothetical protein HZH66_012496 [Vespula vulgaris]
MTLRVHRNDDGKSLKGRVVLTYSTLLVTILDALHQRIMMSLWSKKQLDVEREEEEEGEDEDEDEDEEEDEEEEEEAEEEEEEEAEEGGRGGEEEEDKIVAT